LTTANASSYLSLAEAKENLLSEDIPFVTETADYYDQNLTPVGEYLSQSRTITKVTPKADGSIVFEVSLTGGIRTLDGSGVTFGGGKYPFRTWLSTKLFAQNGRPGQTSSAAQYLREAGLDPKGLNTKSDFIEGMEASLSIPLKVFIGWTDRGEKQADNTYTRRNMKTKDFITGQKEDGSPLYSPVVNVNGVEVKATEKVGSFRSF
jgi:hypothetical protein